MKELIIFAICISLLASLCACTGQPEGTASAAESAASAAEPVSQANASTERYDEQYRHVQGYLTEEGIRQFDTCGHTFTYEIREDGVRLINHYDESGGSGASSISFVEGGNGHTMLFMPETVDGIPIAAYGIPSYITCKYIRYPNIEGSGEAFNASYIGVWEVADWMENLQYGNVSVGRYEVSPDNPNYCGIDGVLYNKDATILLDFPDGFSGKRFTVPSTVTEIVDGRFCWGLGAVDAEEQPTYLEEILIPPSVTKFPEMWVVDSWAEQVTIYVSPGSAAQKYFENVLAAEETEQPSFRLALREFPDS